MNYFYVGNDGNLTPLVSFTIQEDRSQVIAVPAFGGIAFGRGDIT